MYLHLNLKDSCSRFTEIIFATDQVNAQQGNLNPNQQRTCEVRILWLRRWDGFNSWIEAQRNTLRYRPVKCCILSKAMASSILSQRRPDVRWKALLGCWSTAVNVKGVKDKQLWRTQLANCTFVECVVLARLVANHPTATTLVRWLRGSFYSPKSFDGRRTLSLRKGETKSTFSWALWLVLQCAFLNQSERRSWVFSQSGVELKQPCFRSCALYTRFSAHSASLVFCCFFEMFWKKGEENCRQFLPKKSLHNFAHAIFSRAFIRPGFPCVRARTLSVCALCFIWVSRILKKTLNGSVLFTAVYVVMQTCALTSCSPS